MIFQHTLFFLLLLFFFQFTPLITFLTLLFWVFGLQGRVPNTFAGNWFQSWMFLLTKKYFLISVLCLLLLILRSWYTLLRECRSFNLSPIAFHTRSPEYALKRALNVYWVHAKCRPAVCPLFNSAEYSICFLRLTCFCLRRNPARSFKWQHSWILMCTMR